MEIMIDFETLSTRVNCALLEFGYALFEPDGDGVYERGGCSLSLNWQSRRDINFSTIQWWMKQSEAAREKISKRSPDNDYTFEQFYDMLLDLWSFHPIEGIWSHGATFDIPILSELLLSYGKTVPWKYNQARDTRTLFWLYPVEFVPAEVKHSAMHDAVAQALTVQKAMKMKREMYL